MKPKIENRKYSYQGDDVCAVSATLNIYSDADVLVASHDLCGVANISEADFVGQISTQITEQIAAYLTKAMELNAKRLAVLPLSADFEDAVNQILDPIQAAIGG